MKCRRGFLFVLLFVFCLMPAVPQEQELTDRYLSIRNKLIDLKKNSEIVTEQLTMLSENLKLSQQEAETWKQTSTQLSESLMNINEQLNDCYKTIEKQEAENNLLTKILVTMISIFIFAILIKIAGYILYAKGIKLPRWLDILI